jgi:hypothetical protein
MLYGTSKILVERMKAGDEYMELRKVISVNIVYFDLGQGGDYVYHGKTHFRGLHTHDELRLSERQRRVFGMQEAGDVYPEYYILKINLFNDTAKDTLDEWIYFLKNNSLRDEFTAKGLDRVRDLLEYDRLSPEEQAEYDYLQNVRSHNLSMIASARLEARFEAEKEFKPVIAEKDTVIAEKDTVIAEKDAVIAEKDTALAEKDAALARALEELAALKKQ